MASTSAINRSINVRFKEPASTDKFDLYIQGVFDPAFEGIMSFSLGNPSSKVTGLIKLSQQFLITLFTVTGSDIFEPNKGTALAELIGGNYYDPQELRVTILDSVTSASNQVRAQQSLYRPINSDEILKSATVVNLSILQDKAYPYVLLVSEAGRRVDISLPIYDVRGLS